MRRSAIKHGSMAVLDREGLEEAACECYRFMQNNYRLLGRSPIALGTFADVLGS
jgi:hypothetical protein